MTHYSAVLVDYLCCPAGYSTYARYSAERNPGTLLPADYIAHLQVIIAVCTPCSILLKPTRTSLRVSELQMVSSLKGIFSKSYCYISNNAR